MIEQTNKPLTYFAFYSYSGVAATGLSVVCSVFSPAGIELINGNAVEVGKGLYFYSLDSAYTTAAGAYPAVFSTTEVYVDCQDIPALWVVGTAGVDHLDADIDSRLATTGYTAPDLTLIAKTSDITDAQSAIVAAMPNLNGKGSVQRTIRITDGANHPVVGASVWLSTDIAGESIVAGAVTTNDAGEVALMVDTGVTYYAWCDAATAEFTNPTKWEVS